jgi:GNAT superfamily N-acetyltransferase
VTADLAARAIAHRHAVHASVCDRLEPWAHGTAVRASDLPTFYTFNTVRVEDAAEGLSAEALAAVADRLQAGLSHRQVEVEVQATGERLRPGFAALGWHVERTVWMELEGAPRGVAARTGPGELSEVPFTRTRALREAWFGTSPFALGPDAVARFMAVEERVAARRGTRALMAWGPAGEPAGFAAFARSGPAAEVEQVYVEPSRRGRGTGGRLVAEAVRLAGAGRTWIVADDEDEAKRLYARLGFVPTWIQHVFTRTPG